MTRPLLDVARLMQSPLNTFEPFIATLNSEALSFVCPAVFLFLISDYPKIDTESLYLIHRMKKIEWAAGQHFFFAAAVLSYVLAIFLTSSVTTMPRTFLSNDWSHAITDYAVEFPDKVFSFEANLITRSLFNQISPLGAALCASLLVGAYILVVALIILFFHVINLRKAGIIVSAFVVAIGSLLAVAKTPLMWGFPMAHSVVSFHFTPYFREPIFPLWGSFLYLFGLATALIIAILACVSRAKFDINQVG